MLGIEISKLFCVTYEGEKHRGKKKMVTETAKPSLPTLLQQCTCWGGSVGGGRENEGEGGQAQESG